MNQETGNVNFESYVAPSVGAAHVNPRRSLRRHSPLAPQSSQQMYVDRFVTMRHRPAVIAAIECHA